MRAKRYPPSVCPGIPKLGRTPAGWTSPAFGEVLNVVERSAVVEDDREYQLIVAKRNRGGIAPRSRLKGRQIKTKTQFFVRTGDFLIANRQIIHGACGTVPPEMNGALVSGEYTVLHAKNGLWLPFFSYFSHTVYFQQTCFHASIGVDIEKMVFKIDWWLKHRFHLPPLDEQKKIVEILATWDEEIQQTRKLVDRKNQQKYGLVQLLLTRKRRLNGFAGDWSEHAVSEFTCVRGDKWDSGVREDNPRCIELEHIDPVSGRLLGWVPARQQACVKNQFRSGDVLFGKLRPYLRKFIKASFDGVCSSEIWVLIPHSDLIRSDFLFYLVQTDEFLQVATVSSGTKMPRAEWSLVAKEKFKLPKKEEQRAIATLLCTADEEIAALQDKLAALEKQKRGLIDIVLTGTVRVKG